MEMVSLNMPNGMSIPPLGGNSQGIFPRNIPKVIAKGGIPWEILGNTHLGR